MVLEEEKEIYYLIGILQNGFILNVFKIFNSWSFSIYLFLFEAIYIQYATIVSVVWYFVSEFMIMAKRADLIAP